MQDNQTTTQSENLTKNEAEIASTFNEGTQFARRVALNNDQPGILGPMGTFPRIALALNQLAQTLLVDDQEGVNLKRWEREYIAAQVSAVNDTQFCRDSHYAFAQHDGGFKTPNDMEIEVTEKLSGLAALAVCTTLDSKHIADALFDGLREVGCTNEEMHLAIAIGAAFSMYNRYVDACGNPKPQNPEVYQTIAHQIERHGYAPSDAVI
jgi:alkylhydroperoxidase family enzyme